MTLRTTTRVRVLGAAAVAVLVTLVSGCDWIGPGADASRSGYNPNVTGLTATNVASLTPAFRTELDGGAGAPAVTADGVFVYSNLATKSLDRRTGAIRWSTPVPEPDVVSPGENVLVDPANRRVLQVARFSNSSFTRWLDTRTGAVVEELTEDADVTARRDSRLAGVSHSHTGLGPTFTSMSGTDISILLCISSGTPCLQGPTLPTLGEDVVYFGYGNEVQAFDVPTDCPIDWSNPYDPWVWVNKCPARWRAAVNAFPTAPVLSPDGTTVYVGTPAGTLYALSGADGSVRWSRWLASPITKPPALADGVLYVSTTNGTIRAIDATDGTTQWSGSADATHQLAVAGDVVYAAGSNTLTAFAADGCGASTCTPLWSGSTGPGTTTGLAVAYDRVYVSTTTAVLGFAATAPN